MSRPDLKSGGTKLSVIREDTLHVFCRCGHSANLKVAVLIPKMKSEATVADVLLSRRCSKCGADEPPQVRILDGR